MKTLIIDGVTGETIEREMTSDEIAALEDIPTEYIAQSPFAKETTPE